MNYDLDHIRRIQTNLAALPCRTCRRQGLALLLRYDGNGGCCLFDAFCKTCQKKNPVAPNIVQGLNDQDLHEPETLPAITARS